MKLAFITYSKVEEISHYPDYTPPGKKSMKLNLNGELTQHPWKIIFQICLAFYVFAGLIISSKEGCYSYYNLTEHNRL